MFFPPVFIWSYVIKNLLTSPATLLPFLPDSIWQDKILEFDDPPNLPPYNQTEYEQKMESLWINYKKYQLLQQLESPQISQLEKIKLVESYSYLFSEIYDKLKLIKKQE